MILSFVSIGQWWIVVEQGTYELKDSLWNVIEATSRHRIPFSFLGHLSPVVERNSSLHKWLQRWKDELTPNSKTKYSREKSIVAAVNQSFYDLQFLHEFMSGLSNEDVRLVISLSLSVYGSNCTLTNSFDTLCTCNGSVSKERSIKV